MDGAANTKRQLNGFAPGFFKKKNQLVTFMYDAQNPLRAVLMEMSDETTSLFAFKSVVLHFKDTQILALKTVVTGSRDFSQRKSQGGKKGKRRHYLATEAESQFSALNLLLLRFSSNHNKSTVNAFIRKNVFP